MLTQSTTPSFQEQVLKALTNLAKGQVDIIRSQANLVQNQMQLVQSQTQLVKSQAELKAGQEVIAIEILKLKTDVRDLKGHSNNIEDKVDQILDAYAPQIEKKHRTRRPPRRPRQNFGQLYRYPTHPNFQTRIDKQHSCQVYRSYV